MADNKDTLIRFMLPTLHVRGCMIRAAHLRHQGAAIHGLGDEVAELFAQMMAGAVLMLSMSKGGIRQVLQLDAMNEAAPVQRMLSEVQSGHVRGYVSWQEAHNSMRSGTDRELASWMGSPLRVSVVRDFGRGEPYVSTIESNADYMADHLTHFTAQSIQTRADFVLRGEVGLMLEAMPGCQDVHWHDAVAALAAISNDTIDALQESSLQSCFAAQHIRIVGRDDWRWHCHCQPERMTQAIARLPHEQLQGLMDDHGNISVNCQYCRKTYTVPLPAGAT